MTRIRFEDLPSTNTPRNAENLNKLNNVVISPTEPTTGEEVWIDNANKKIYTKNDNDVYEEFNNVIVESGSNENGSYVKYADGRMECYGELLYENVAITNSDYGTFYAQLKSKPFPQVFNNNPITVMQIDSVVPSYALWLRSTDTGASATATNKLLVTSAASCTASKIKIHYHAKGRWK